MMLIMTMECSRETTPAQIGRGLQILRDPIQSSTGRTIIGGEMIMTGVGTTPSGGTTIEGMTIDTNIGLHSLRGGIMILVLTVIVTTDERGIINIIEVVKEAMEGVKEAMEPMEPHGGQMDSIDRALDAVEGAGRGDGKSVRKRREEEEEKKPKMRKSPLRSVNYWDYGTLWTQYQGKMKLMPF